MRRVEHDFGCKFVVVMAAAGDYEFEVLVPPTAIPGLSFVWPPMTHVAD